MKLCHANMICVVLHPLPPAHLTSALVAEVWEEDVFLGEDKQAQPAAGQGVVVDGARVGQDLPALVHHHPAIETNNSRVSAIARPPRTASLREFQPSILREVSWRVTQNNIRSARRCSLTVTRSDCRPSRRAGSWMQMFLTAKRKKKNKNEKIRNSGEMFARVHGESAVNHSFCLFEVSQMAVEGFSFIPRRC